MRKRRFDLVLTDKNLPGASGLDVLRAARKLTPAPAIVLITGYSSYDSAIEAMDVGALDYIEKPIRDVDDLRFRIRRALSRRDEQLARRKPPTTAGKAGRVLLVEVEGQRRQLLAEYLGKAHHVTAAKDGDEALMLLKSNLFDLVLADRHLPGVSGLRVIEHAQQNPAALRVRAVHGLPLLRVRAGGVRGRRRRISGPAQRRFEKVGREGRRSARRARRNPVRVTASTEGLTCELPSRTTCG